MCTLMLFVAKEILRSRIWRYCIDLFLSSYLLITNFLFLKLKIIIFRITWSPPSIRSCQWHVSKREKKIDHSEQPLLHSDYLTVGVKLCLFMCNLFGQHLENSYHFFTVLLFEMKKSNSYYTINFFMGSFYLT